jgi:hypothetical protein
VIKKEGHTKRGMALSQVSLLVISLFAFSYMISEINLVSAVDPSSGEVSGSGTGGSSGTTGIPSGDPPPAKISFRDIPPAIAINPVIAELSPAESAALKAAGDKAAGFGAGAQSAKFGIEKIGQNALVAAGIFGAIQLLGPLITSDKGAINAISTAASIGYFLGSTLLPELGGFLNTQAIIGLSWGGVIGLGAGILVGVLIAIFGGKTAEETVTYSCNVWDAPTGGKDCEKCNEQGIIPCTEYMCKSLGQACELVNKGTTEEQCAWLHPDDVAPPVIEPWEGALLNNDYKYEPDTAISPPDRGTAVVYNEACIPAFTPFQFGIKLDEPGKCKIDPVRKDKFDDMAFFFGGSSTLKYNHTQIITLPGPDSLASENITLQNNGNFDLYVRCQDANGNANVATFVFKYCVDKGPDTTPPVIIRTSVANNSQPIGFNQTTFDVTLDVNEPAECKWNHERDTNFDNMEGTFKCSTKVFELNAEGVYKCTTTLTGLVSRQNNNFYFRCKDKPQEKDMSKRNENTQGYLLTLIGTQPLVIDSAGPEGIVKGASGVVKVTLEAETSAGYKEGEAICYYSESCYKTTGSKTDYTAFYYALGVSSHTHSQDLWMPKGNYECSIRCIDLGGNTDSKTIKYTVEADLGAPQVVRAYKEENMLKIITSEEAGCVYSTNTCNYLITDGVQMDSLDDKEHFLEWDPQQTYHVKCQDEFGNQPLPNQCSIVVKASEDY